MPLTPKPAPEDLPSSAQLARATGIAAIAAVVILITTVLPSEYGIDPTGIGRVLGLTQMGEMKRAEAQASADVLPPKPAISTTATLAETSLPEAPLVEAAKPVDAASASAPPATAVPKTDEIKLTLVPGQGTEVKAVMKVGEEFDYTWATDGAKANYDLHGEPHGAPSNVYTSYEKGVSAGETGKFRAPFDGTHGWFWRNRTPNPITITVRTTGVYEKVSQLKQ